jgi:UDP-glucose 4-epimerase
MPAVFDINKCAQDLTLKARKVIPAVMAGLFYCTSDCAVDSSALRGDMIKVFGTGEQLRDFNYVDDVTHAILLAASTESCYGRVFNLGADERYSLLALVNILNELCPLRYEVVPFPDDKKIIDIGDYYSDYTALRMATGWRSEVSLHEGLQRTLAAYRSHRKVYL